MVGIELALVVIAALVSIAFGVRYFLATQFMPYHAVVAGRSWSELEPGIQTVIRGFSKIAAAGFLCFGMSLLWLLIPLSSRTAWAPWALLSVTVAEVAPTLYVTLWLRRYAPSARTPVLPAAAVLAIGVLAAVLGFLVSSRG